MTYETWSVNRTFGLKQMRRIEGRASQAKCNLQKVASTHFGGIQCSGLIRKHCRSCESPCDGQELIYEVLIVDQSRKILAMWFVIKSSTNANPRRTLTNEAGSHDVSNNISCSIITYHRQRPYDSVLMYSLFVHRSKIHHVPA